MRSLPFLALALLGAAALAGCSSGGARDGDHDGLTRSEERGGWDILVESMEARTSRHVTSDPREADTDGDGATDLDEFALGTDPREADTDGDGLTDCQERLHTDRAACEDPAWTGEGDGGHGTDPAKADSDPGPSRFKAAQPFVDDGGAPITGVRWGDGLSDGAEVEGFVALGPDGGPHRVASDPREADSDGDGLEDAEEILLYGGDPTRTDTDGDGCADGGDPWPDAAETYAPGLLSFRRLEGGQPSARSGDVRFDVLLVGHLLGVPEAGTLEYDDGEAGLAGAEPEAVAMGRCALPAYDPWTRVQAIAQEPADAATLDIFSLTGSPGVRPDAPAEVWWDVRGGRFAWTHDGAGGAWPGPVAFHGQDGVLTLHPRVVLPDGAATQATQP